MYIRIPILVITLLISSIALASINDSIRIRGNFLMKDKQTNSCKGVLYQFKTRKQVVTFDIINGFFVFKLPVTIEPGVYRLLYGENSKYTFTDVIIDGKEREINFELRYLNDGSPVFLESIENQNWYNYLKNTRNRIERLNSLFDYLSNFSEHSSGKQILKIYQKERRIYNDLFSDFVKNNGTTWAGLIVANNPHYFSDLDKEPVPRDFIRINYYWEDIDTSNQFLINTPVYVEHIESYLSKIISQSVSYSAESKDYKIKRAIDEVIERFSNNSITKKIAIECIKIYLNRSTMMDSLVRYVAQKGID